MWQELLNAGLSLIQRKKIVTNSEKLVVLLIIGTIPAMILGLLLEKKVETAFRSPLLVGISLILFSTVLWYVERVGRKYKTAGQMSFIDSLIIGTAQAVALIPGVSRSGITMAGGMWRGLARDEAARFAFLLSAPIIAGAGGLQIIKIIKLFIVDSLSFSDLLFFATGMISAAIFGYLTIKYFLRFISKNSLMPFVVYRVILGIVIITLFFLGFIKS